jgi:hypothetical protein
LAGLGGLWPGIKLIEGARAEPGDPEYGVSRGRLLPRHTLLGPEAAPEVVLPQLQNCLILVDGGMAQNVGPILEMVTEKYLLRAPRKWEAGHRAGAILDDILEALRRGDVPAVGAAATRNFEGPIQAIIPWASNAYTEALIERARGRLGDDFWGFWMLGGMSDGGMGFLVAPGRKAEAQIFLQKCMSGLKREMEHSLPFAMEPVVYEFATNQHGTTAELLTGEQAWMSAGYYEQLVPRRLREGPAPASPLRQGEMDRLGAACRARPEMAGLVGTLFDRLFPATRHDQGEAGRLGELLRENGFDPEQHARIRSDLRRGLTGLAQNRLPANTVITDVGDGDVPLAMELSSRHTQLGREVLAAGGVAVVTLAAGWAAAGPRAPRWSRRSTPSASSAAGTADSWRSTSPRAGARAGRAARRCPTSSPRAT